MDILTVLYSVFVLACLLIIYAAVKNAKEKHGNRLNRAFLFIMVAVTVAAYFNLYQAFGSMASVWVGTSDSLLLVSIIVYVISGYHLKDIKVAARKGLVYAVLTAILSAVYLTLIYVLNFFFKTLTGYGMVWVTLPLMFGLAVFFQPLKNRLQGAIDKYFFKTRYEADQIRAKFTLGISKLMRIDDLAEYINRVAFRTFKLSGCAVYVFDEDTGKYFCHDARGTFADLKGKDIGGGSEMIAYGRRIGGILVRDELDLMIKEHKSGSAVFSSIRAEMKGLNARIFVPSVSKKKDYRLVGFLIAGEKKSQDRFSEDDILLLETIANQAVMNIENAVLYQAKLDAKKKALRTKRMSELGAAAANVAKEARSALTPIINFSEQFKQRWNDRAFIESAEEFLPFEVERLRLILLGILEFSKESKLNQEKQNLAEMLDGLYKLIGFQARNRNVALEKNVPEDIEINADKDRLKHVLLNLFINSLDAMPYGGRLLVSAEKQNGAVGIKISDTGGGIPQSIIGKVFDPFFTTKKDSIGLGLSIVKKVIEGHGGSVAVESPSSEIVTEKGTTFFIKL